MDTRSISPMLATLGRPPARFADFAVEAKYDGQRGLAVVDGGGVTLLSRNGADITRTFPEITAALPTAVRQRSVILDGEIVAPDDDGVPCFSRLQRRWPQNRRPSTELLRQVPVRFFVFDVLRCDGKDITSKPYASRRERLLEIPSSSRSHVVQFPGSWTDVDPTVVLTATAELGLEGIVCKHLDSAYIPGLRTRYWSKTPHRTRSDFVIGGWLPGVGVNRHTVGALLVGAYSSEGRLRFCGVVGAGLSDVERRRLTKCLQPLQRSTSPFPEIPFGIANYARWVQAEVVGTIEYREFGATLRHPSWKGLRADMDSALVTLPQIAQRPNRALSLSSQ
jgi:bifunctional non-homologous end joining protein LigD